MSRDEVRRDGGLGAGLPAFTKAASLARQTRAGSPWPPGPGTELSFAAARSCLPKAGDSLDLIMSSLTPGNAAGMFFRREAQALKTLHTPAYKEVLY